MDFKITFIKKWNGGMIHYEETGAKLAFDWEVSPTGAIVFVPSPKLWSIFCKPLNFPLTKGERQPILENMSIELCRRKFANGTFKIYDDRIIFIFNDPKKPKI